MKLITEPFKNWFGFSRRERRATFILLILIVLITGIRYAVPDSRMTISDITGTLSSTENAVEISRADDLSKKENSSFVRQDRSQNSYRQKKSSVYNVPVAGASFSRENADQNISSQQKPLIDLNLSDSATLVSLPGIGPVLSARIIKYRRLLGGFARIEQLKEVYGLPPETYEVIKSRVFADSSIISRININTAVYKELARLHYLEKYEITAILKYRQLKGKIIGINDLIENKLMTVEKAGKVNPYLKYDE